MLYKIKYKTPDNFDDLFIISDEEYLLGIIFNNSNDLSKFAGDFKEETTPVIEDTIKWLDVYFKGEIPNFIPKYRIYNLTPFRSEVSNIMLNIPYGKSIAYGDIADIIKNKRNIKKMSSQAVGGAVGSNPICIIIPCHRVLGKDNSITGYGGGIINKMALLDLENADYRQNRKDVL